MPSALRTFERAFLCGATQVYSEALSHLAPAWSTTIPRGLPTCEITETVALPGQGPVANVFQNWEDASEAFSIALAAEAVAQTNQDLRSVPLSSHEAGSWQEPANLMFDLVPRTPFEGGLGDITAEFCLQFFADKELLAYGDVCVVRFDLMELWEKASAPRLGKRKRSQDEGANNCEPTLSENPYRKMADRMVYRHCVATSKNALSFFVGTGDNISGVLRDLCGGSKFEWNGRGRPANHALRFFQTFINLTPFLRQGKALDSIGEGPDELQRIVYDPRRSWQWKVEPGSSCMGEPFPFWELDIAPGCTEAQRKVVQTIAGRMPKRLSHGDVSGSDLQQPSYTSVAAPGPEQQVKWVQLAPPNSVCLSVQGPPGSGKSTVLVEVMKGSLLEVAKQFDPVPPPRFDSGRLASSKQPRFLVTAPTNKAVDELLARVVGDSDFLAAARRFQAVRRTPGYSHKENDLSAAISRFLQVCTVVRVGRRSEDSRPAVVNALEKSVVKAAGESAQESLEMTRQEIERLEKLRAVIDRRTAHISSLYQRVQGVRSARDAGEPDLMEVDGKQCALGGNLAEGLGGLRKLQLLLQNRKMDVDNRLSQLQDDLSAMTVAFYSFLAGSRNYDDMVSTVLENAVCVFTTCDGAAAGSIRNAGGCFDLVLVDEAARATIPQLLVPVATAQHRIHASQGWRQSFDICCVGDPAQNAATVISPDTAVQKCLGYSWLERAQHLSQADTSKCWTPFRLHLLDMQFRLHPSISLFSRNAFYASRLLDGLSESHFALPWHLGDQHMPESGRKWYVKTESYVKFGPLLLVNTAAHDVDCDGIGRSASGTEIYNSGGNVYSSLLQSKAYSGSRANLGEAVFIVKFLVFLSEQMRELRDNCKVDRWCSLRGDRDRKPRVMVMTTYKFQARLVSELLGLDTRKEPEICELENFAARIAGGTSRLGELHSLDEKISHLRDFFELDVSTVDAAIGREVDFALVSRVAGERPGRGNRHGSSDFLTNHKRLCVALTRAASLLVVIGSFKSEDNRVYTKWDEFSKHCREKELSWPVDSVENDLNEWLSIQKVRD